MATPQAFDLWGAPKKRRPPYRGSLALVHVPRDACPRCGAPTGEETVAQVALFRHAGHGADLETTRRFCSRCTWGTTVAISETRPR